MLAFRERDGSNQANGYADYTGYPAAYADYPAAPQPVNTPDVIHDPNHWQPLRVANGQGGFNIQTYLGPHWGLVTPFALTSGRQFRPAPGPATTAQPAYLTQAVQILAYSATLTDTRKAIAEYWKDGPRSETPPATGLSSHSPSRRATGIGSTTTSSSSLRWPMPSSTPASGWDAKRFYISVRPITAIHYLFAGHSVIAWAGPCQGTRRIAGQDWLPYQPGTIVTPPFPEYVSGHSTFSAAAATILTRFTGSDRFGSSITIPAHSSEVEPGCSPAHDVTLSWETYSAAAEQAGLSRRYGGIHFQQGDLDGRHMGRLVGETVWQKAQVYLHGRR